MRYNTRKRDIIHEKIDKKSKRRLIVVNSIIFDNNM